MKRLLLSLWIVIGLCKCNDTDTPPPENPSDEVCISEYCLGGEWNWVVSYGSIAGLTITPATEMIEKKLIITDESYQEYIDDVLSVEMGYDFYQSDELEGFSLSDLVLSLENGDKYAVMFDGDTLMLREPCFDCWDHTYSR